MPPEIRPYVRLSTIVCNRISRPSDWTMCGDRMALRDLFDLDPQRASIWFSPLPASLPFPSLGSVSDPIWSVPSVLIRARLRFRINADDMRQFIPFDNSPSFP